MRLARWQGLGNVYLIVEVCALPVLLTEEAIGLLCDPYFGIGSDGILLHDTPSGAVPGAVARMRIFNPDGSEPEMCGNGIRMFARYLVRSGAVNQSEFVVETLAGAIKPRLLPDGQVRVDMGLARFHSANIYQAVFPWGTEVVDAPLSVGGRDYRFTFVDVGNPHCVIQVDDPASFDVVGLGPVMENHPFFPHRANVEFISVEPDGSVRMRVWERGVGETQACGTGATAVGAAVVRLGLATSPVVVHLLGGDLTIEVEGPEPDAASQAGDEAKNAASSPAATAGPTGHRVFMTGPAEEICECELSTDLLQRLKWMPDADHLNML